MHDGYGIGIHVCAVQKLAKVMVVYLQGFQTFERSLSTNKNYTWGSAFGEYVF
jgi:hypothetical protein